MQHSGEHALPGHNAVAHPVVNGTVAVTFLPYLGDFQQDIPAAKPGSHRKTPEINSLHHQIFSEGARRHPGSPGVEIRDLVGAQQAHLPVPVPFVGVIPDPPVLLKPSLCAVFLLHAADLAGADSNYLSHFLSSYLF